MAEPPTAEKRNFKKAVKQDGLEPGVQRNLDKTHPDVKSNAKGVAGDAIAEGIPTYIITPTEKIIQNRNNAYIVLGRDRIGNRMDGHGMRGETQAGAIDIVVGRMGSKATKVNKKGETIYVDPIFHGYPSDAARIYISQKTDIDKAFYLVDGQVGHATTRSAIALKADGIRLIAREGIKLVTGIENKNSQGGDIGEIKGIDLIAGNYGGYADDTHPFALQPLVKGSNLVKAIEFLVRHVADLTGIMDSLVANQIDFNAKLTEHTHISPFEGRVIEAPTGLAEDGLTTVHEMVEKTRQSCFTQKKVLVDYIHEFLRDWGDTYILSRFNNTN
mgnify:CR=1 FL=1